MKKVLLSLTIAIIVIITVGSCKKAAKLVFPDIPPFDLPEVVLPLNTELYPGVPYPLDTAFTLPTIYQHINMDSIVRARTGNNFGAGDIRSIKLNKLKLDIVQGYNADTKLSNFNFAKFNLALNPSDTGIVVAYANFAGDEKVKTVVAGADTPELLPYVKDGNLYYVITASMNKPPKNTMKFSVIATLTMK